MTIWDVIAMLILTWGLNQIFKGENPDRPRYWNMNDSTEQIQYKQQTEKLSTFDFDSAFQAVIKGQ